MARQGTAPGGWVVALESDYSRGIIRDTPRSSIPPGGVYDAADVLLDQPGQAYGRGAFTFQSSVIGTNTSKAVTAVGTLPLSASAPTVVALVNGHLWNVTAGVGGTDMGACTLQPICNLPVVQTNGSQILVIPASDGTTAPKKVYDSSGATLANLGGSPPAGKIACVHLSYLLLANTAAFPNRLYFSKIPNVESAWGTSTDYIDFDDPITGLASVGGVLLVFSSSRMWRVLGTTPPGTTGEDMSVQPVASVGCVDARSIVVSGNVAYFASSEGVYESNGAGVESITDKADSLGISSYWRDTFAANFTSNTVIASGVFRNRWLFTTINSPGSAYAVLSGGGVTYATLGSLSTGGFITGSPNYTAQAVNPGTAGNSITITITNTGTNSVSVMGNDITITYNASTGTWSNTIAQIAALPAAAALISISNVGTGGGGRPASMSQTSLSGGTGGPAGSAVTLICHLPSGTWQRFTNTHAYMYTNYQAAGLASKLYGGWSIEACVLDYTNCFQYVKSIAGATQTDAGVTSNPAAAVTPFLETRMIGDGPGLKAYGHAHLTYNMLLGTPTMAVQVATGPNAESGYGAVAESPLAGTTQTIRKRFIVNKDAQAVSYRLIQAGASGYTEINLIETEVRQYQEMADGP